MAVNGETFYGRFPPGGTEARSAITSTESSPSGAPMAVSALAALSAANVSFGAVIVAVDVAVAPTASHELATSTNVAVPVAPGASESPVNEVCGVPTSV